MHQIENEFLRIGVKQTGAELCSIQSVKNGREYMWEGDPAIWGNHAPVLFPIVGGLKDGTYLFEGKSYQLPRHGIVRYNKKVQLVDQDPDALHFELESDPESLTKYPFPFRFRISFSLVANRLRILHQVENTGPATMYFSLGAHPAFRCPLIDGESYADHYLEFEYPETARTWVLDEKGLIAKEGMLMMDQSNQLALHEHLFDADALIFKNLASRRVSLRSRKAGLILRLEYPNWPYLGIWAKPQAPFVCIEPWQGIADHSETDQELQTKIGIMQLAAGKRYAAEYVIELGEELLTSSR
ncbi:MAG: aldose 1-epimerase family protein [Bacteroidota bacterium]